MSYSFPSLGTCPYRAPTGLGEDALAVTTKDAVGLGTILVLGGGVAALLYLLLGERRERKAAQTTSARSRQERDEARKARDEAWDESSNAWSSRRAAEAALEKARRDAREEAAMLNAYPWQPVLDRASRSTQRKAQRWSQSAWGSPKAKAADILRYEHRSEVRKGRRKRATGAFRPWPSPYASRRDET